MAFYILTSSTHDDYQVIGLFTGPDGVDIAALAKSWASEFPEKTTMLDSSKSSSAFFDDAHFRQYVIDRAGLQPAEWKELWLPDYCSDMRRLVEEP